MKTWVRITGLFIWIWLLIVSGLRAQDTLPVAAANPMVKKLHTNEQPAVPGDQDFNAYLPALRGKKVGLVVNQTSEIGGVLLPDTLLSLGIHLTRLFSPEHGLRGTSDAGEHIADGTDTKTGLPVVSLYGKNKKPSPGQLQDIDVMVYDLQDVGVRFYTYISTLQYVMEACAEKHIPLIVLDRPDPLGFMVDGPLVDEAHRSFVGMQPVPVVYGMTAGEYAQMLVGEKWLGTDLPLALTVIKCHHYNHNKLFTLRVPPSPNLKTMAAVYLYPSLCLFEGTVVSVGRGTGMPFQVFGNPLFPAVDFPFTFVPEKTTGASEPVFKGQECHGQLLAKEPEEALQLIRGKLQLKWLIAAYKAYPDKDKFFNDFFVRLAGTDTLGAQIRSGMPEAEIRKSWEPGLKAFMRIRARYLLY